jgi:hypothetical protein
MMASNKVKTMTEFTSSVNVGVIEKEFISKVSSFDRNGLKRQIIVYGTEGNIESKVSFDYDKNNNLVLSIGKNSDSTFFKETRSYDKNNNRIDLYHYLEDGTYKYKNTNGYDDKGKVIQQFWYWPTGLKEKRFYVYEGENITEETAFSPNGALAYSWKYKYDEDNNMIEAVQFNPGKKVLCKILYSYIGKDQLVKRAFFSGESLQNTETYEYDKNGLLSAKTIFNPYGKETMKYRYEYEYFQ